MPPTSAPKHPSSEPQPERLPIVEEHLEIGTRVEEVGALRVRIETDRHRESVPVERSEERVEVERVRVDRPVDAARSPWMDGETLVVPIYAEVPVIERRLVLVEELRLHRRATRRSETAVLPLRQERAVVERRQPDGSWQVVEPPAACGAPQGPPDAPISSTPSGNP